MPNVVNSIFALMPQSARIYRMSEALSRILTSMLPRNKIQHDYNHSSERIAIIVKQNHRQSQSNFRKRINNLPDELRTMIIDQYFEAILVPGEVEPFLCEAHRRSGAHLYTENSSPYKAHRGSPCFLYNKRSFWCRDALRTMGSKIYNQYNQRYWSENTVVSRSRTLSRVMLTYSQQIVRSRRISPSLTTLRTLPNEITGSIRSVRIVFGEYHIRKNKSAFDYYEFDYYDGEHLPRWWTAAVKLPTLKLQHLVIDVRGAYNVDGEWLGSYWASRLLWPRHYIPKDYEVVGPNSDLEEEVRYAIDSNVLW